MRYMTCYYLTLALVKVQVVLNHPHSHLLSLLLLSLLYCIIFKRVPFPDHNNETDYHSPMLPQLIALQLTNE